MSKATQTNRHLAVETPLGPDALLIQSFTGAEQLGRLFSYELELLSETELKFHDLIGKNVTVRLERPDGKTRYFNGFVSRLSQGQAQGRYARYRATVVPWLWFLTRTADCRIFQEQTVPDIIKKVCKDHSFTDIQLHLSRTYRTWEYCVQYRETAFNFVSRLMEQEGIYYYFAHENGKHTLHLCDAPAAHEPIPGYEQVPFRDTDAGGSGESVWDWRVEQELQTGVYSLRDFDFNKATTELSAWAITELEGPGRGLEVFDYPGEYTTYEDGASYATIRLQELEAHGLIATGQSDARGVAVGHTFELIDSPHPGQNGKYLITAADYDFRNDPYEGGEGTSQSASCRFGVISSQRQFRPLRTTPKPIVQGPQTAIVVGPANTEIHTDSLGRIKVQFHWDREGKADENSSCWLRVSQVWGGIDLPRVHQEVIVAFMEGDPDRPMVLGRVYNSLNKPPYSLPETATVSGLKNRQSRGSATFNEVRLEDKKGEEQLFIHAEKNADVRVKNDEFEWVGHDSHLIVKHDRIEHIENNREVLVDVNHIEKIGNDRNLLVGGKEAKQVGKSLSLKVKGDVIEVFQGNQSTVVGGNLFIKASNIVFEAKTNITIKVGQSYIAIESGGIKLGTTGTIELEATAKVSIKGTAGVTVESPSITEVKGSMVKAGPIVKLG